MGYGEINSPSRYCTQSAVLGRNWAGEAHGRGVSDTPVGFREGIPEEATCKLREQKGVEVNQMEMGRGVVGIGKFQREKRTCRGAQCLETLWW